MDWSQLVVVFVLGGFLALSAVIVARVAPGAISAGIGRFGGRRCPVCRGRRLRSRKLVRGVEVVDGERRPFRRNHYECVECHARFWRKNAGPLLAEDRWPDVLEGGTGR